MSTDHAAGDIAAAFSGVRLHVITGKGGTGKTTVAAGLALALAHSGLRVLLCEVEGRQATSRLFGCPPLGYSERTVAQGRGGGSVQAMAVEPRAALMDYLDTFYVMGGRAGKILDGLGAVDFATTIAPGLRDVLLTGKVYEAAKRTSKPRRGRPPQPVFDAVVVDAPPTGRITKFLNVSTEVSGLARIGPVHNQAQAMQRMMHAPTTRVHLVTLLEEMPVQEATEAIPELQDAGFSVGAVFANRVRLPEISDEHLAALHDGAVDASAVETELRASGVVDGRDGDAGPMAKALLETGRHHADRVVMERGQSDRLTEVGRPVLTIPAFPAGMTAEELPRVAETLMRQGVTR